MMNYSKTVKISSCHFNGAGTYANYNAYVRNKDVEDYHKALEFLEKVVVDMHGHNFIVQVNAAAPGKSLDRDNFFVDDEYIEKTVMLWDRKNITLLPEFAGLIRVTLEAMCIRLAEVFKKVYPETTFAVTIWETENQFATYTI